jgi:lysozyme
MLSISPKGVAFVQKWEGCRLEAYEDSAGIPTIGTGHIAGVKMGDTITQEQADDFLRDDLQTAEDCVNTAAPGLTQNQFDACVSLAFNIGCGAFKGSTLCRLLWAGDFQGAASQFARWNRSGGRVVEGLSNRRRAEAALFSEA